ncbi:MAG: hypothetical protein KA347_07955 [Bacteroidia bacterium]|jgi:hypothetical protein|nr:hypothetical protein [Bacteroidia bacterium]
MNPNTTLYWNKVLKLHREGYPVETIQNILKNEGLDEVLLTESLCKLKLILYKKRKSRAVIIMITGAFIMLFGFIITVVLFHYNHNFDLFLYGFTVIGLLVLSYGVYEML